MNHYHQILCQALTSPLGLLVAHENPRSAIQRFRQEKSKDPVLFAPLRFFPDPRDSARVMVVRDRTKETPDAPQ